MECMNRLGDDTSWLYLPNLEQVVSVLDFSKDYKNKLL